MKRTVYRLLPLVFWALLLTACSPSDQKTTHAYFESHKSNSDELQMFFHRLPKGGELHHHAIGSVFAEELIEVALDNGLVINPNTFVVYQSEEQALSQFIPDSETIPLVVFLNQSPENTDRIIDAWSMRNYTSENRNGHDWFFASFFKFKEAFFADIPRCLSYLTKRAKDESVLYLETMINVPELNERALDLGFHLNTDSSKNLTEQFDEWYKQLIDSGMEALALENIDSLAAYLDRTYVPSDVHLNFMAYGLRIYPRLEDVFTETMFNFISANRYDRLVGVNFVAPEDNPVALEFYREHMAIFKYFYKKFPDVNISLHAGELTEDLLPEGQKNHIQFHIKAAIDAGAKRIGHAYDLFHEDNYNDLLDTMEKRGIAVEINLVSNEVILNSKEHPLSTYFQNNVPVCLSTDDAGILRTSLAAQYAKIMQYMENLNYDQIKTIAYNSIIYSFAPQEQKEMMLNDLDYAFKRFEEEVATDGSSW